MAWTGGEYDEEDDEDQLSLTTISDVLAVTREDQEMLSEAHKALRREIKSIRKSLKNLVRQFYAYADAQESTAPARDVSITESRTGNLPSSSDASINTVSNPVDKAEASKNSHRDGRDHETYVQTLIANTRRSQSFTYSDENPTELISRNDGVTYTDDAFHDTNQRPPRANSSKDNGHTRPSNTNVPKARHHRPLVRSSTQPAMRPTHSPNYQTSHKEDITYRSLSRNGMEVYAETSEVEDMTSLLDDLELTQLSNTYPGTASKSRNAQHQNNDHAPSSHQQQKQNRPRSKTPRLRETGRKKAQLQFSKSDLPNSSSAFDQNRFGTNDDTNGMIMPDLEPQLTSHLPPDTESFQIPSQRTTSRGGSQYKTAPTQGHRVHKTKETDEPPATPPPPPPPQEDDTTMYLISMEADQVGSLPEFHNSFQSLPRRLSTSEISAISGGKRAKQIPPMRKLRKRSTHDHIAVTEVVM